MEDSTHLVMTGNSFRGLNAQGVLLRTTDASKNTSAHFTSNQVSDNADPGIVEHGSGSFDTITYLTTSAGTQAGHSRTLTRTPQ